MPASVNYMYITQTMALNTSSLELVEQYLVLGRATLANRRPRHLANIDSSWECSCLINEALVGANLAPTGVACSDGGRAGAYKIRAQVQRRASSEIAYGQSSP